MWRTQSEGGARGDVLRGVSGEISNVTAGLTSRCSTGIIAMLGADVNTAPPAVAQTGQICVAEGSDPWSKQKWNCPNRNSNPRSKSKITRMWFRGILLAGRSLGNKGRQVKGFVPQALSARRSGKSLASRTSQSHACRRKSLPSNHSRRAAPPQARPAILHPR